MNQSQKPLARKADLVVQELPDEVLVYDLQTNKAHCLNSTAAAVWKSCDGANTVGDIARIVGKTGANQTSEDLVWLAIDQLNEKNLLDADSSAVAQKFAGQTRREVIKKVGLAAVVALPIVTSLVAPTVASAGSTCANPGCTCTFSGTCTPVAPATTCDCNSATGTNNCPSQCTGGCSTCTVASGTTNGTCAGTCS
jgi:hypothetical protein